MKIFYLPDLGEGLAEAEIREWYVHEGDEVKVDQPLVSMETAKAVVDVPSPYDGKIVKLHGKPQEIIQTGAPLISYEGEGQTATAKPKGSVVGALEESSNKWEEGEVIIGKQTATKDKIKAMPAARVLANELNIDLKTIKGTGPQGLITPNDVKAMLNQKSEHKPTTILPGKVEALHGVRRIMAQAMVKSHQNVVPVTIVEDADISALPAGTDLTAKTLWAMAQAAKKEPALNAWFDGETMERKLIDEVNIGLAVDSPEGLIVPVIKDVANQSLNALRQSVDEYKKNVAARKVLPEQMHGTTITLSNFGTMSGKYATPIIVPPAVAIIGVGRMREAPVVKNGEVRVGKIMPISLTFDHRAVTGGEATRFLQSFIEYLITP